MIDALRVFDLVDETLAVSFFPQLRPIHRLAFLLRLVLGRMQELLDRSIQHGFFGALMGFDNRRFAHVFFYTTKRRLTIPFRQSAMRVRRSCRSCARS